MPGMPLGPRRFLAQLSGLTRPCCSENQGQKGASILGSCFASAVQGASKPSIMIQRADHSEEQKLIEMAGELEIEKNVVYCS